jgi:hypothetical protein
MEECHTVCTTSEQIVKNTRFWLHKVYTNSHTKLGTQVHNHTVSLPQVLVFFLPSSGQVLNSEKHNICSWYHRHAAIDLKKKDLEFEKRWLKATLQIACKYITLHNQQHTS